jgi:biotin carboxylase
MSETQRKKATLVKVLDSNHNPVNIQAWLEKEYGVQIFEVVTQGAAFDVLEVYFEEEDWDFEYYLFEDELYEVETSEVIDTYGHVEAILDRRGGIQIDATWYDGGAGFSECVNDALSKLSNEL